MRRSEQQKDKEIFCVLVARGFSPEEAFRKAGGIGDCAVQSAVLLGDAKVRRRITRLVRELAFCAPAARARAGLERLALAGSDSTLPLLEEDGCLSGVDLFNVAEIKRPKGGGIEIKFFDRLRALSQLAALDDGQQDAAEGSLLAALARSAAGAGDEDDG